MSAWLPDLLVRLFLFLRARLVLRRPADLARLGRLSGARFLWEALCASGRHLALAVALLPRAAREEATVAYLCCRVLDAHEDLCATPVLAAERVCAATAYLTGAATTPPPVELSASRESDAVEVLLARRAPELRAAIDRLPPASRERVHQLLARMAGGMLRGLDRLAAGQGAQLQSYGDDVLGTAVGYAASVLCDGALPDRARRAAGRLLQLANHVRDVEADARRGVAWTDGSPSLTRSRLLLAAAAEVPLLPQALRALPFPQQSGARGALSLLVLTTAAFFLRQVGLTPRGALAHPVGASLRAALSPRAYARSVSAAEDGLRDALRAPSVLGTAAGVRPAPPARGTRARAFEEHLARSHPRPASADTLAATAALIDFSAQLLRDLPAEPLRGHAQAAEVAPAVMMGDQLLAQALSTVSAEGARAVRAFGELLTQLSTHAQAGGAMSDTEGDVAAFLSGRLAEGWGLNPTERSWLEARHRGLTRALQVLDGASTRAARRSARAALKSAASLDASAPARLRERFTRDAGLALHLAYAGGG